MRTRATAGARCPPIVARATAAELYWETGAPPPLLPADAPRLSVQQSVGRVVVLGGGIAGLAAAHELRRRGYRGEVVLFEAEADVGGVARSGLVVGSAGRGRGALPTEYSWRGLAFDYRTLHELLREIPLTALDAADLSTVVVKPRAPPPASAANAKAAAAAPVHGCDGGGAADKEALRLARAAAAGTVEARTQDFDRWFLASQRGARVGAPNWRRWLSGAELPSAWRARVFTRLAEGFTACAARVQGEYARITWESFMGMSAADGFVHDAAVRAITPALGPDPYRASASCIVEYIEGSLRPGDPFYMMVFDAPTSEAWFRHWHRHLAASRVDLRLSHRVRALRVAPAGATECGEAVPLRVVAAGPDGVARA